MRSKHLLTFITVILFAVVTLTPLFYIPQSVYPYILSKTLFFQSAVELLFFAWLMLIFFDPRYRIRFTPILKALALFLGVLMLTSLFGADAWRSFWSTYERMFGIFTILHLAALALVISSFIHAIPWRKLFYASLLTSFIVALLASLQTHIKNFLLIEAVDRPGATFGNPTFLAGYLLFQIFIALYFLLDFYRNRRGESLGFSRFFPYLLFSGSILFNLSALFLTQTRGDIFGLAVGIVTLGILFAVRPPDFGILTRRRSTYVVLLFIILGTGFLFLLTKDNSFWSGVPGADRFRNLSAESLSLQPRLAALRAAWRGFLEKPLTGFGWENFNVAYNKYYDPRTLELNYEETRFDKPHNFFMEDLASGGIPLALARLGLLGIVLLESLRLKDRLLGQIFFASVITYFVRNLFIFDTIGPALMLFIFIGLLDGWRREEVTPAGQKIDSVRGSLIPWFPLACGALVSLICISALNVPTAEGSLVEYNGFKYITHGDPTKGIAELERSTTLWSPYQWNFARDFATATTDAYFYNRDIIPADAALRAIAAMEGVVREHPSDAYNHYTLVDMYNQISDINPSRFFPAAEKEAAAALALSPNRQEIYFSLAKTKTLEKDYPAAITLLQHTIALDDKVPDAHFYYGIVSYAAGDQATGYHELETVMTLGRQWVNFYEPRTVADFFADSGHLDEAIPLYEKALAMVPAGTDKTETEIKLGVAYFYNHEYDKARQYLLDAGKTFDYSKSASYSSLKPILSQLGVPASQQH